MALQMSIRHNVNIMCRFQPQRNIGVTGGGRTAPGNTLKRGDTRRKTFLWANLQIIVDKRGRIGKKVWGDTLQG